MNSHFIFTGKRFLVVDDDAVFLSAVKNLLEELGGSVVVAADGRIAQSVIAVETLDLVITDIKMPGCSGIELLHYVKRAKPELPLVLITGFGELKETKDAHELGAKGFLTKPFSRDDLKSLVVSLIGEAPPPPKETDADYCKLNIDDFITGKQIKFDIFIRLAQDKFVKIAHEGDDIAVDRILHYKKKNITHLHMRKCDFIRYIGFSIEIAKKLTGAAYISGGKKVNFVKHAGEIILEQCFLNEFSADMFEASRSIVETTVDILAEVPDMATLLDSLNQHSDHLYAHCVGVSFYSSMISRAIGWESSRSIYKVSMAGLLHDIGKKDFDKSFLQKSRGTMSPEEVKLYQSHPTRGVEILSTIKAMPGDVLQIVQQHHENCLGTGWPSGLKKTLIHPMARIVTVANELCSMMIKTPWSDPMPILEALEKIYVSRRQEFDHGVLEALVKIFNPETIKKIREIENSKLQG